MKKIIYPDELEYKEWIKRQNYFLSEQNLKLKKQLFEAEEYINTLLDELKLLKNNLK